MKFWNDIFAAALLVIGLSLELAGCSTTMQAPALVTQSLSDKLVIDYGESMLKWWGARSTRVEALSLGAGLSLDALTTAALATSAGGVSPDIARGLVAGVNFILAMIRRIDPGARDNAFNEGSGIVIDARGKYAICLTHGGSTSPSDTLISKCGAVYLDKIGRATKIVGSLMAGLLPHKSDLDVVQTQ